MKRLQYIPSLLLVLAITLGIQTPTLAAVSDTGFSDVSADAWYADAVKYCVENDLMSGTAANTFSPNIPMSRAMLATVLYRMAGSPQITGTNGFSDVAQNTWYTNAITWAAQNEIVSGYGSGLFGTSDPVTREQIATILWRYSGSPTTNVTASSFSDAAAIATYAVRAINWAQSIGVINGKPGNLFDPKGNATRAEVATVLRNHMSAEQSPDSLKPDPTPQPTPAPNENESDGEKSAMININITVGSSVFSAKLYDNDAARALLARFPMTLDMSELNGNEKYYYLPERLPTASEQVGSIRTGDLMLYGSDCLVLFYESFSTSYSYTRLGYIEDSSGFAAALGNGSARVTFAVAPTTQPDKAGE